jgi:hypothetical protein
MWTAMGETAANLRKTLQITAFRPLSIARPTRRICGWIVDDVCVQMYESNLQSNYYNRFSKIDSV